MASFSQRFLYSCAPLGAFSFSCIGCGSADPAQPNQASVDAPAVTEEAQALHAAARAGDLDELRRLLDDTGTPIDAGDRYGASSLMMASNYGHVEVVRYLLDAGADVNHRESFFNTSALDLATWKDQYEVAVVLIAAGSDQREDAMALAIREERPELAQAAVAAGPLYASAVEELLEDAELPQEYRDLLQQAETRPDPAPPQYTREQLEEFAGQFQTWDEEALADLEVRVTATDDGIRVAVNAEPPVALSATG